MLIFMFVLVFVVVPLLTLRGVGCDATLDHVICDRDRVEVVVFV